MHSCILCGVFLYLGVHTMWQQCVKSLKLSGKAPVCGLQVSRLVVSEIVSRQHVQDRVACIEKWAAIADICRCVAHDVISVNLCQFMNTSAGGA